MFNHIQLSPSNPDELILTNNNSEQNNTSNSNNNIQFNTPIITPYYLEQGQKKQIKFVNQILILESGNFIVGSNRDIIFYNQNFTIKFKKEKVTNSGIADMCLIDQNTFGVCSHRDIIIIKIIENNFKIIRIFVDPHDNHWVNSILFSKNKILISSSIYDEKIKVWDILNQSDQPIQQLNHDANGLLEWNENIFISSGYSKTKIWNKINNKLNYQLMNTFTNISAYLNNGIKKYDDNSIIIGDLNYGLYIINIKTMEATKKILPTNDFHIYCILNLKNYLILGGEVEKKEENCLHENHEKEGFIHVYKKKENNKFKLIKNNIYDDDIENIVLINNNYVIFGENIIPLKDLIN